MVEIKFVGVNWWGYKIYRTALGTPLVHNGDGFYSLSDHSDMDSEPCSRLKDDCLKIVEEFSK